MSGSFADGPGLTWDELDDLADYVAGTLTGASADRVATLIQTDSRWAAAHAALTEAEPLVRSTLQAAAADPPPMPDDVAARLDALIANPGRWEAHGPTDHPDASPGRLGGAGRTAPPSSPIAARRPESPGRRIAGPPSRSRGDAAPGRARRPVVVRVLTAVLVLSALGGFAAVARQFLLSGPPPATMADAAAEGFDPNESPLALPPGSPIDMMGGTEVFSSGIDYRRDTLSKAAQPQPLGTLAERSPAAIDSDGDLSRPTIADQLPACLNAVGSVHPGVVTSVEYARFEGEPALILLVRQNETSTVVAVGLDCGITGPDILAAVEVP